MLDKTIRHSIFLQRYAAGEFKRIEPLLRQLRREIKAKLNRNRQSLTIDKIGRLNTILADIEITIRQHTAKVSERIAEIGRPLAEYELGFYQEQLSSQVTVQLAGMPASAVNVAANPQITLVQGREIKSTTIAAIVENLAATSAQSVVTDIQKGLLSGATPTDITRTAIKYLDGTMRQHVDSVVRTYVSAISSESVVQVALQNQQLLQGLQWVSTLDKRTTPVCQSRDGKIYPITTQVRPPAHFRCRSVMVMTIKDQYRVPGIERTRSSSEGQIPAGTTYPEFFKRLDSKTQREILGPRRYELYKKGGLTLDKFVDSSGISYTLEQLKLAEPVAWSKAFI